MDASNLLGLIHGNIISIYDISVIEQIAKLLQKKTGQFGVVIGVVQGVCLAFAKKVASCYPYYISEARCSPGITRMDAFVIPMFPVPTTIYADGHRKAGCNPRRRPSVVD